MATRSKLLDKTEHPTNALQNKDIVAPGVHPGEGGVSPTVALHFQTE